MLSQVIKFYYFFFCVKLFAKNNKKAEKKPDYYLKITNKYYWFGYLDTKIPITTILQLLFYSSSLSVLSSPVAILIIIFIAFSNLL